MLCIDTSSMIAFLEGAQGHDVDWVDHALSEQVGVFSPVTLTELLSDPQLSPSVRKIIVGIPLLPIINGFWERAASIRAKVLSRGQRARLADTLIAQTCLDHHATLITRDNDFHVFKQVAGLKLL